MFSSILDFLPFDGVIFDMDGVLSPTEPISCNALRLAIIDVIGVDIGLQYDAIIGLSLHDAVQFLSKRNGFEFDATGLAHIEQRKKEIYFELASGNLHPTPGLFEFLGWLEQNNIGYAIASSGSLEKIQFTLKELSLENHFKNRFFSSSQVKKGKPFPDIFKLVATQMGWNCQLVLVIEDSPLGIRGAVAADMVPIGLASSFPATTLYDEGAVHVIRSFWELLP